MPEGDSVWKVARTLEGAISGKVLTTGRLNVPAHATADLSGCRVLELATHGKHLLTRLEPQPGSSAEGDGPLTLHTHQRMDGRWTVLRGKVMPRRAEPDVRVELGVGEATAYGMSMPVVDLLRTADEHTVIGHLGPDLLHARFDASEALARFTADPARPLAATMLDQRVVAGIGNLWANELSFLVGASPWTPVREVDALRLLARARRALAFSATSPTGYQVTTGDVRPGRTHWVAGREGKPCWRCKTPVLMAAEVPGDAGRRRTWWCPVCQPGPGPDR